MLPGVLLALPAMAILLGAEQVARTARAEYLHWKQRLQDVPEQIEQTLAPAPAVLPAYGHIGYLNPDHSWADAKATRTYYLTQYALAPRIVTPGVDWEYVIYFSHRGHPLRPEAVPPGMRVLLQIRPEVAVLTRAPEGFWLFSLVLYRPLRRARH